MSDAQRAEVLRRVREFLLEHGASEEEVARAEAEDVMDLLVADRLLVPSHVRYNEAEVSELTGMPIELSRRFWRALGFPTPSPEDKLFTDLDVEAVRTIEALVELGVAEVEPALQLARVIGSSMSRIADAEVSPTMLGMFAMTRDDDNVEAADRFARLADHTLPAMSRLLEFVWRRHVQAAVRRAMLLRSRGESGSLPDLSVGFADMVGFTMLSQQLSEEELAALVSRFEDVAYDVVTSHGGRVVKMIGDEVMFVAESPVAAAHIGLALAESYADDELLSDVRVALAVGPVLVQDGDYYGPVVNLANRVADVAAPGSVLVTDDFHAALLEELGGGPEESVPTPAVGSRHEEGFAFSALRPRTVKDVGRVQLWSLYRPGTEPMRLDRRLGRRWERLSEVLRELDDLRERGEKLISGGLHSAAASGAAPGSSSTIVSADGDGASRSGLGAAEGGYAEGPQREGAVEGGDGRPPQVD
ncbi:MAG TPA: adenylate cyclase regulatory domain-containing protein [Acidimicrobiales bacterium]|nr:adenylate cyclase regulatory domain-containing protein [Acidimicrobiales bacterium]